MRGFCHAVLTAGDKLSGNAIACRQGGPIPASGGSWAHVSAQAPTKTHWLGARTHSWISLNPGAHHAIRPCSSGFRGCSMPPHPPMKHKPAGQPPCPLASAVKERHQKGPKTRLLVHKPLGTQSGEQRSGAGSAKRPRLELV